ncbi:MAG: MarR family winged helix-turn-helix transcriptional regulator [Acidimicrobiales bacterium]
MTARTPTPEDLADTFFSVAHALRRVVNARFQPSGLSLARLRVLYQLKDRESIRIGELSHYVDVAPRTMTSTVDAMERDGLVDRQPDPTDGRATIISVTTAGRRSFEEGVHLQAQAVADLFDVLDAGQRRHLVAALDQLADAAAGASSPPHDAATASSTARA